MLKPNRNCDTSNDNTGYDYYNLLVSDSYAFYKMAYHVMIQSISCYDPKFKGNLPKQSINSPASISSISTTT